MVITWGGYVDIIYTATGRLICFDEVSIWQHIWKQRKRRRAVYIRCIDITDVIVIACRHVGGTLGVNKNKAKMRKSDNSYANVFCEPCLSTSTHNS